MNSLLYVCIGHKLSFFHNFLLNYLYCYAANDGCGLKTYTLFNLYSLFNNFPPSEFLQIFTKIWRGNVFVRLNAAANIFD